MSRLIIRSPAPPAPEAWPRATLPKPAKYRALIRRMMNQGPDHRVEIVGEPVL